MMSAAADTPPFFPSMEEMFSDAEGMELDLSYKDLGMIVRFSRILLQRSSYMNLIGPGERKRLWNRHILESACYSLLLDRTNEVVDIGTGNGFPGVILAVMGFRVVMLEPRRKKFLFLRHAITELELDGCTPLHRRLEDHDPVPFPSQYTARSVAPPEHLLEVISGISGKGSTLACRQPAITDEMQVLDTIELRCPPLDRSGFLVQYRV